MHIVIYKGMSHGKELLPEPTAPVELPPGAGMEIGEIQKLSLLDRARSLAGGVKDRIRHALGNANEEQISTETGNALVYVTEETIRQSSPDSLESVEAAMATEVVAVEDNLTGKSEDPITELIRDRHTDTVELGAFEIARQEPATAEEVAKDIDRSEARIEMENHAAAVVAELAASKRTEITDRELGKLSRVETFFLEGRGIRELVDIYDGMQQSIMAEGGDKIDLDLIKEHSSLMVKLAFDQHFDNPEQYVSHGFDHTLNVTKSVGSIIDAIRDDGGRSIALTTVMEQYGIQSEAKARFLLQNVGLLHDVGFPEVDGLKKAAHAVAGAAMVDGRIGHSGSRLMKDIISDMCGVPEDKREAVAQDLSGSILLHSADTEEHVFSGRVDTIHGTFLLDGNGDYLDVIRTVGGERDVVPGGIELHVKDGEQAAAVKEKFLADIEQRLTDRKMPEDEIKRIVGETSSIVTTVEEGFTGRFVEWDHRHDDPQAHEARPEKFKFGLQYSEVVLAEQPLHAIIRLADNMDASQSRFSEIQSHPVFQEFYKILGHEKGNTALAAEVSGIDATKYAQESGAISPQEAETAINAIKQSMLEQLVAKHETDPETAEKLRELAVLCNEVSFRHFGGCEAVLGVGVASDKTDGDRVEVLVDHEQFKKLNETVVQERVHELGGGESTFDIGVGDYQIWRMQQAYKSIRLTPPQAGQAETDAGAGLPIHVYAARIDSDGKPVKGELIGVR